jgi:hypothetical protein
MPATTSVTAFRQACKNSSRYRRSETRHQKKAPRRQAPKNGTSLVISAHGELTHIGKCRGTALF